VKIQLKSPFATAIAMSVGLVVLLGYFFGANAAGEITTLGWIRDFFLRGAVLLAAMALLVGIANLSSVHAGKIRTKKNAGYSLVLLVAMFTTILIGLVDIVRMYLSGSPNFTWIQWVFTHIQLPVETSLMAILAVTLTYAAARLLGRRMTIFSALFTLVLLLLLLGAVPQFYDKVPMLADLRAWIINVPAVAGGRGILLGVALGTIATGIRILMGSDRPYRG
jgi:hypothetical protein